MRELASYNNAHKTDCAREQFPRCKGDAPAPFALLRNSRKTECSAKQLLIRMAVRAAPFALLKKASRAVVGRA
jgi:hypothetical protein